VFDDLLELADTEDIQDELKALAYMCQHYDYVQVLAPFNLQVFYIGMVEYTYRGLTVCHT
jgi:hypothetical protein